MAIEVAEAKSRKQSPAVLDHLEIHPQLGGGHIIKHVYSGYQHDSKDYKFNTSGIAKGGETIAAHLAKHAGITAARPVAGESGDAAAENED